MHITTNLLYIFAASIIGFAVAWAVGANDLANMVSPALGSKSISSKQAIIFAIVFEFAGAFLGGVHVTHTVSSGIINLANINAQIIVVYGMLATLLASMTWIIFASFIGMPVSITNAVVGGLVGFGFIVLGKHAIHWNVVMHIAISWICSPLIAGVVSYLLFILLRIVILGTDDPIKNIRTYMPFLFFMVGIILADMIVLKDVIYFEHHLSFILRSMILLLIAFFVVLLGLTLCKKIKLEENPKRYHKFDYLENVFKILVLFTVCALIFAHGANDVSISIGPVVGIFNLLMHHNQHIIATPTWIVFLGCMGVVIGLIMYGRKIIETVGSGITNLTPSRAFVATLAAALTVIFSTNLGIPVSATQTLVGGVFGVGMARSIGALNVRVMRNILLSWFITVPVSAVLAIIFFNLLRIL